MDLTRTGVFEMQPASSNASECGPSVTESIQSSGTGGMRTIQLSVGGRRNRQKQEWRLREYWASRDLDRRGDKELST